MGRMVSATEFDARFARLLDELSKDGEAVSIVQDGVIVAELTPKKVAKPSAVFGTLRSRGYRSDWDHEASVVDLADWNMPTEAGSPPPQ